MKSIALLPILGAAAAVAPMVSIAANQILLGLAIVALAIAWRAPGFDARWPRAAWPLAAFAVWTLVSLAASPDPAAGMPQVKKFYVYLVLIVVLSAIRSVAWVRVAVYGWAAAGSLSALWAFGQGIEKYLTTEKDFYLNYSNSRVTGFSGHWMTFSGLLMMALLMIGALLLFSPERRFAKWLAAAGAVIALGILAAFTRSMWAGTAVGAAWLLWSKNKRLIVLLPVGAALVLAVPPLRQRVIDAFRPQSGALASAEHRSALRAVGVEMVREHPWVGVGPELVNDRFVEYSPKAGVPVPPPVDWYYGHLHNVYVHYAAERGLPAAVAIAVFFGLALFDFARGLKRAGDEARWVVHGAVACVLAVGVSAWWEVNLGDSEVLAMYLSVVACGYAACSEQAIRTAALPPDRA